MQALRLLRHPNVVELLEVAAHGSAVMMVFEYMPSDLSRMMQECSYGLPQPDIKAYMRMLLQGLAYCHANFIVHRVGNE